MRAKKSGLDLDAVAEWSQHWQTFEAEVQARLDSYDDPVGLVLSAVQGSDLGRRYFRRNLWTRFRVNVVTGFIAETELSVSKNSTEEELVRYQEAALSIFWYGIMESLYNTLMNAGDDAQAEQDVYPRMYEALRKFFKEHLPVQRIVFTTIWNQSEAIASLSGWFASKETSRGGRVRHASYRNALGTEYYKTRSRASTNTVVPQLSDTVAKGLLSELPAEAASVLLQRLREAETGSIPGGFDLDVITKQALNNIRKALTTPKLPSKATEALNERQTQLPVDQEAMAFVLAEEMLREARRGLASDEYAVFEFMQGGKSGPEIAEVLHLDVTRIYTLQRSIRKKLRKSKVWSAA